MDSTEMSVHQISRGKAKTCKELVAELVYMILDDESYLKKKWDKRIELVTEVRQKLKDPQFVLERLASLLQPIIEERMSTGYDIIKAESALQELQSFLKHPNNTVPNQDGANEFHNSYTVPNQFAPIEDIHNPHEWMLRTKEESHSINEELNQIMAILEQKDQLMKNVNVYVIIAKMLEKVVYSCSTMAYGILDQDITNLVQGYHGDGSVTYDRKEGQLRLIFPPTPVHDQEVINQEKQSKEVTLTIRSVAGRLAELNLANPEMIDHLQPEDFDYLADILDDTCIIHNYKVSKCNADALREIFDKHPKFDENFGISHPDFKNSFMNSLAGLYTKIKSGEENMLLEDITSMEPMVRDMEFSGLQISWLQEKLTDIREKKTLLERIASNRAKAQKAEQEAREAEQQLAKLKKKRQFD